MFDEKFIPQDIYNSIVNAQRQIINTKDAYDLEIQSCEKLRLKLFSDVLRNQINLKRFFSLKYEYKQFFRFDISKINWTFFSAIRDTEAIQLSANCENWNEFLEELGIFCRQIYDEKDYNIIDLLTYSTFPSLFGLLSDLEIPKVLGKEKKKNKPSNLILFTIFLLKEFLFYQGYQKNFFKQVKPIEVPLEERIDIFLIFSRSIFLYPPFIQFVRDVFVPVIQKVHSFYPKICTIEKVDNNLIENPEECFIEKFCKGQNEDTTNSLLYNLFQAFKENIDQFPIEITNFFKAVQIAISTFIGNSVDSKENDKKTMIITSYIFYANFFRLLFTEPGFYFVNGPHQNFSLFETDTKFETFLKNASLDFVSLLIKNVDEETDFSFISPLYKNGDDKGQNEGQFIQPMPKYILIDHYDKQVLKMLQPKKYKVDSSSYIECLNRNYSINQYQLFKINLTKSEPEDETESYDDDNEDDSNLDVSFNGAVSVNGDEQAFLALSLFNLITVAPPLPKKKLVIDFGGPKKNQEIFGLTVTKVLYDDIHSMQNAHIRFVSNNNFQSFKEQYPKTKAELASLFDIILKRSNPNSYLIQHPDNISQKENKIIAISKQLLKYRVEIKKEKKRTIALLEQSSSLLYIMLFRQFILINYDKIPEIQQEVAKSKSLPVFINYWSVFPKEAPKAVDLSSDINHTSKLFSIVQTAHNIFKKNVGHFEYSQKVIHNSFFRNLTYYLFLVAKPYLIAMDMALSARFMTCKEVKQYNENLNEKQPKHTIFVLPIKVIENIDLIEEPRKAIADALSANEVPLNKAKLMCKAFNDTIKVFSLKKRKIDAIVEVISYIIASLHCMHFESSCHFVLDFVDNFYDCDDAEFKDFFDILERVSRRLNQNEPKKINLASASIESDENIWHDSLIDEVT